jgi:hypothetical protein
VVQRDRLEEGAHGAVDRRRGEARAQHGGRVVGQRGEAMTSPGTSRSTPTALSLWKWPPKPFW